MRMMLWVSEHNSQDRIRNKRKIYNGESWGSTYCKLVFSAFWMWGDWSLVERVNQLNGSSIA